MSQLQCGGRKACLAVIAEASQLLASAVQIQDHYVSQTNLSGCGKVRERNDNKPLNRSLQMTSAVPVVSSFGQQKFSGRGRCLDGEPLNRLFIDSLLYRCELKVHDPT